MSHPLDISYQRSIMGVGNGNLGFVDKQNKKEARMNLTVRSKRAYVDPFLKVGLEATLARGALPQYTEGMKDFLERVPPEAEDWKKMIHRAKSGVRGSILGPQPYQETKDKYYSPLVGPEAFLGQSLRKVSFLRHITNVDWWKLSFERRSQEKRSPAPWMCCGRDGEKEAFGFNAEKDEKKSHYLSLAYPGKTGVFEPLFIKVVEYGEAPYFLKVDAHDADGGIVVVEVSLVSILKVPVFLRV